MDLDRSDEIPVIVSHVRPLSVERPFPARVAEGLL